MKDSDGLIQACLTYKHTGQQRSMSFQTLPASMQVSPDGGWSLGPTSITPWSWVAELGVVLLLFVIGLELDPQKLWRMKRDIFGLGTLQVVLTGIHLSHVAAVRDWNSLGRRGRFRA